MLARLCGEWSDANGCGVGALAPDESLRGGIKRRTDAVGVFPNPAALLRLAGAI